MEGGEAGSNGGDSVVSRQQSVVSFRRKCLRDGYDSLLIPCSPVIDADNIIKCLDRANTIMKNDMDIDYASVQYERNKYHIDVLNPSCNCSLSHFFHEFSFVSTEAMENATSKVMVIESPKKRRPTTKTMVMVTDFHGLFFFCRFSLSSFLSLSSSLSYYRFRPFPLLLPPVLNLPSPSLNSLVLRVPQQEQGQKHHGLGHFPRWFHLPLP